MTHHCEELGFGLTGGLRFPAQRICHLEILLPPFQQAYQQEKGQCQRCSSAAEACLNWQSSGLGEDINVSVNLSLKSLADTTLADRLTKTVADAGLHPKHMVLEITESAAMTDVAHCLENLARLRMKGFGLSIDDYGTGYSSMQQLSRIPFSELKIDRSFVTDVALYPQRRVILASSIDMARKLGLKVVAEGVESRVDWDRLKELGCTMAQGYFIAKPMPAAEFSTWAANFSAPH